MKKLICLGVLVASSLIGSSAFAYGSNSNAYGAYHKSHMTMGSHARYSNIVDAAMASKNLSTLVAALKAGGLVSALQGKGPFIVFAPTNQAFNQLAPGTLSSLLKPSNKYKLQNILKYHVISGRYLTAKTLQGKDVTIKSKIRQVNGARVLGKVKTGNGTVYIINKVLLPK